MFSLAFNLILFHKELKIFQDKYVGAFMLVHYFIWLSVRVEFKFEFEFKQVEWCLKQEIEKKREGKGENPETKPNPVSPPKPEAAQPFSSIPFPTQPNPALSPVRPNLSPLPRQSPTPVLPTLAQLSPALRQPARSPPLNLAPQAVACNTLI